MWNCVRFGDILWIVSSKKNWECSCAKWYIEYCTLWICLKPKFLLHSWTHCVFFCTAPFQSKYISVAIGSKELNKALVKLFTYWQCYFYPFWLTSFFFASFSLFLIFLFFFFVVMYVKSYHVCATVDIMLPSLKQHGEDADMLKTNETIFWMVQWWWSRSAPGLSRGSCQRSLSIDAS